MWHFGSNCWFGVIVPFPEDRSVSSGQSPRLHPYKGKASVSQIHQDVQHTDLNPEYGNYEDPDPVVEVVDTNDYYFSDYEVGSGRSAIRDNNPYYE